MHLKKKYMQGKDKRRKEVEISALADSLSKEDIKNLIAAYEKKTGEKLRFDTEKTDKFVDFLKRDDVHIVCPYCNGKNYSPHDNADNRKIRFYCYNCKKAFSPFKDTLVYDSGLSWEVWVELVHATLENTSLVATQHRLEQDHNIYLNTQTILAYRHKIQKAIALTYPMPKLSGVVQVDETYFREGQKGSRNLINVIPTVIDKREARLHTGSNPSNLGIFGPEFCCVVVGTEKSFEDNRHGHIAAVVTGLGKSTSQAFGEYFSDYLGNVTFLCSDGYEAYSRYCEINNIPHYVRMSEWQTIINRELRDYKARYKVDTTEDAVREKLYPTRQIDYIDNFKQLTYKQFKELKTAKKLTLDDIDNYHGELKLRINKEMRGVSTIYLHLYIAFRVFVHNWRVDHDDNPPSSMRDAEQIFTDLLMAGNTFVAKKDLEDRTILDISRPTTKYVNYLKKATDEVRMASQQKGFVFDDSDRLIYFNKRKYFENTKMVQLKKIAKDYHIKGYTKMTAWQLAREICKLPEANDIFIRLVATDSVHAPYTDDLLSLLKEEEQDK